MYVRTSNLNRQNYIQRSGGTLDVVLVGSFLVVGGSRHNWKIRERPVWLQQRAKGREVVDEIGEHILMWSGTTLRCVELSYHHKNRGEPFNGV